MLSPAAMAKAGSPKDKKSEPEKSASTPQPSEPPPAEPATGFTAWRTWAVIGVVLVGGVIAWRLFGSSYKGDVETICNGEKGSGFTVQHDMPKVSKWIRDRLATPEGNELFSTLSDAKLLDRAKKLQLEADANKVASCPIVQAYQQVAAEGEYRSDLQRLCSSIAIPKLAEMDDAGRLAKIEEWINKDAKSPRTKELIEPLRQGTPADRAKLLRDAASKYDVFSCEVAKTIESPPVAPAPPVPKVRVWASPQINGGIAPADLAKAIVDVTPAMTDCYKDGLAKKADLGGKAEIKIGVDPNGKVTDVTALDSSVTDRDVMMCTFKALKTMKLPKSQTPLVTVLIPLEMTTGI
jgi:hypothetical protein